MVFILPKSQCKACVILAMICLSQVEVWVVQKVFSGNHYVLKLSERRGKGPQCCSGVAPADPQWRVRIRPQLCCYTQSYQPYPTIINHKMPAHTIQYMRGVHPSVCCFSTIAVSLLGLCQLNAQPPENTTAWDYRSTSCHFRNQDLLVTTIVKQLKSSDLPELWH